MKLQEHLQQWADEGLYDWKNGTFQWDKMGNSDPRDLEPFDAFRFVDDWEPFVQCVLDGTIPVWRPVGHYLITDQYENCLGVLNDGTRVHVNVNCGFINTKSLEIDLDDDDYDGDDFVDFDNVTHWMPLPKAPKKAGEQ